MRILTHTIPVLLFFGSLSFVTTPGLMPVDNESNIRFTIKNFGVNTGGIFKGLQGKIKFDPHDLAGSFFDVNVDANSINTDINARDNHLRKEEYLNTAKYPKLSFTSRSISKNANGYTVTGGLMIRGTTKEISFPFTATPMGAGYVFKGKFSINRRDFKVGGSSLVLGDNVNVSLTVFAK